MESITVILLSKYTSVMFCLLDSSLQFIQQTFVKILTMSQRM